MTRYSIAFSALMATAVTASGAAYSQCGGQGWSGATDCVSGYSCQVQNAYYSQCVPGAAAEKPSAAVPTTVVATTLATMTKPSATSAAAKPASTSAAAVVAAASGKTQYAGVNIAGFDFGCDTSGTCSNNGFVDPGTSGIAQMKHFASDDKLNIFRLPFGWQYMVKNTLGGALDTTFLASYDKLVQGCLATGATCILDLHNYARWNGAIVGQGGPTNAQFADVWSKLATKYKSEKNVMFGLMNEPHELTMTTWATSVQAAVDAIRKAGATSQYILVPGTDYTSAGSFVQNSGPALLAVKDTDGSTGKIIFDVHRYLDSDNSGTHTECTSDHVEDSFVPLAKWLRTNGRKAILSEVGGGNVASCEKDVCAAVASLNENSDVYLGYVGWSAGAFDASYVLGLTPNGNTDTSLLTKCFSRA